MTVVWIWLAAVVLALLAAAPWAIRDFRRAARLPPRRRVRLLWEPRDMWLGVYREPARSRTYICLIPCVAILLEPRRNDLPDSPKSTSP